jgi:large subunit ribosomal protein L4
MDGTKAGVQELPDTLFGVEVSPELVHQAIIAQRANARIIRANTKDRSAVRGGGRKPWKQKGTGRARHGSRRSPIWIGGGVTFGPNLLRNFSKKINKKAKRKALAMMLTDKVADDRFIALDTFDMAEAKTKVVAEMRQKLPGAKNTALIVTVKGDESMIRGAQNLQRTETIGAESLNVRDLARYQYIIASKAAIEKMVSHFA